MFELLLLTHFECFSIIVKNEIGVVYDAVSFAMVRFIKKNYSIMNHATTSINMNLSATYLCNVDFLDTSFGQHLFRFC